MPDGGFLATVPAHTGPITATFTYKAKNSQGTVSACAATVTLTFQRRAMWQVTLVDGKSTSDADPQDYRWIIEEDRTCYQDPNCTSNPAPCGLPGGPQGIVPAFGTNFHTSHMPVIAAGLHGRCLLRTGQTVLDPATGTHVDAACDMGNGICRRGPCRRRPSCPAQTVLDPAKRYYIVGVCRGMRLIPQVRHAMGGAESVYAPQDGRVAVGQRDCRAAPLPTATVISVCLRRRLPA